MTKFGFQLSSITPYLDTAEHLREAFDKIAAIGYSAVQLQGVPADIPDSQIAAALRESGLECIATQEDYPFGFGEDPDRAVERAVACGSRYLVFALLPPETGTVAQLEDFAQKLMAIREKVRKAGLVFAYHPITPDFRDMEGVPVYERLMALLPPDVQLTFCVSSSFGTGCSYEHVLEQYSGRTDLVHFKDSVVLPDGTVQLMPLGEGSHDWKPILKACTRTGVKWVFAEQERWNRDAFDCAAASFRYLKALGMKAD